MKSLFVALSFSVLASLSLHAQEGCSHEVPDNVVKLLEKSKDTKKYEAEERMEFLDKAIEEDPNCLPCLQRKGELLFLRNKRNAQPFATAKEPLEKLVELCPEFHSEPYYFLGAMCYADREYEKALVYFDKFMRFPDSDPTKFEKDYDKKYKEVEEALPNVKAYADIYKDKIEYNPIRVSGVSSANDEYLPIISPDGEILFYTRTQMKQAKGDIAGKLVEEFTWSKRPDINANFDGGFPLPPPFNRGDNYGGAAISVDNKELIIAKKNPTAKNPQNIDLFATRYDLTADDAGKPVYIWSALESLGPNINTEDGWEAQPSLSGDGQYLFFATVRANTIKDASGNPSHDLFYSKRQADGTFGMAQPVGGKVNTAKQEKSPFMHSDSRSLYFASDGQIGVGGMDIFYCKMNDDGTFTEPKNIGYPINSEQDEIGIVVSSDGELAYFGAKNFRQDKGWNIYEFKMPEKAKPEKVMILKGVVKTEDGNPAQNAQVELKYTQTKETEKVKVNGDDGTYAAVVKLAKKEDVMLSVQGDNVAFNTRVVARKDNPKPPVVTKMNMEAPVLSQDKPIVINDIYYSTSRAELAEDSKVILDEFAQYLIDHPNMVIEIRGHTDNVGNDQTNLALSMERAYEVLTYLVSKGAAAKNITSKGYGETKPVASNDTEEGRAKNRRTEFVVKKQ